MTVFCLLNIPLNFFLVFATPAGFTGIAISTVASAFVACMLNLFQLRPLLKGVVSFSPETVKRVLAIGWPIGLLQVAWQLGTAFIFFLLGFLPVRRIETIAALTNGLRIESLIFLPAFAFNMANAVIVGNTIGKDMKDEAAHRGMLTALIGVAVITVTAVIVVANARWAVSFLSDSPAVRDECVRYLYIILIGEPFMAWGVILAGGLTGAGDTKSVMKIVTMSFWLVRIPLCYIFGIYLGLGAAAIWWSMNISIFIQCALISKRYFGKAWLRYA
jgi:putative MATE family efflux protein